MVKELISYTVKDGCYVNSVVLAKDLKVRHQDLIRRVKRVYKNYLPYVTIQCKYTKGGRRINYKLRRSVVAKLGLLDVAKEMDLIIETESRKIEIMLDEIFGM